jgi:hypothetical protein
VRLLAVGEPADIVWWRVAAALVVSVSLQIGVNYANDYSDGVRGTDDVRVGPTRLVAGGLASPSAVMRAALLSFAVAAVAGLAVAVTTSLVLLLVGAAAIAAGWFYTGGTEAVRLPGARRGVRVRVLRARRDRGNDVRCRRVRHGTVACDGRLRRGIVGLCAARRQQSP